MGDLRTILSLQLTQVTMAKSPAMAATSAARSSLDRRIWGRFADAVAAVLKSEIGRRFRLMFGAIVVLLMGISGLNVLSSYVGRDLMTAIEQRSAARFFSTAVLSIAVFAGLTAAAVLLRFIEERLALLWRDWLTRKLVDQYLHGGVYLRLRERGELGNPDQRISDDARAFTSQTLSFVLIFLNAGLAILSFSGVMWSISPLLFLVAVGYAGVGSLATIVFGRPLIRLNYDQSDREASFRAELVHVGANAESVALLQLEGSLKLRLQRRLAALLANMKRIVAVNRNLSFFTTGYAYGIQLVPPLIVGPLFINGKVEFGVITQSAMAFSHLLGAFSLIVTQFQALSSFAAVVVRLGTLSEAMEGAQGRTHVPSDSNEGPPRLVYDELTLRSPSGEPLVAHLTVTVPTGTRLLITGTEEARRALFRATALGPHAGDGFIHRPGPQRMLFLPERPYIPPGVLREAIVRTGREHDVREPDIRAVLGTLGLEASVDRWGGLDVERDWGHVLSLGEQQLFGVACVILAAPAFVVLQSPGTTLAPEQLARALAALSAAAITYVDFGGADGPAGAYDAVLELHAGGTWGFRHRS